MSSAFPVFSKRTPQPEFIVTNRYRSQTEEERRNNLQQVVMQYLSRRLGQPQQTEDDPAL